MSWFHERKEFTSEKNGTIVCVREWGRWSVMVQGYVESAPYMLRLWKRILKRVPTKTPIKKILILGLGAGGNIRALHHRFPQAKVTAIEWDPIMIQLADALGMYPHEWRSRIIFDEASHAVEQLQETYDLILFDLYLGNKMTAVHHPDFIGHLVRLLDRDGYLLFNACSEPEILDRLADSFSLHERWQDRYNAIAIFSHIGRGLHAGDPVPKEYVNFRAAWDFLGREATARHKIWRVGTKNQAGLRWQQGPVFLESYMSDEEPKVEPFDHWRCLIWRPITRMDTLPGWFRLPLPLIPGKTGFATIVHPETYWENWDPHALRHRSRWLKDTEHIIEEVSLEDFIAIYKTTTKLRTMKGIYMDFLRKKWRSHGALNHYFVVRRRDSGKIEAGLAVLDIPETHQSVHLIAFFFSSARKTSINVGLIDHWFKHCIKQGLTFLDFDLFRGPTDPAAWDGFSRFKGQFGTRLILYPNALVRFIRPEKK